MADPTPYVVSYSFSGFQASNPTAPPPGPSLDNEFVNAATAIASLVSSIKDVRNPDGTLKNGSVTLNQLSSSLQLTVDPTNGTLVAAAVATTQANATATNANAVAAAASAASALTQANNAAASAGSVNLALFLPKAGNLAGIGNPDVARANVNAAKVDGSDMTGRVAPLTGATVLDWNTVVTNGWFTGTAAANAPDAGSTWLAQVIAVDAFQVTQIAYNITGASQGVSAVNIVRRHAFNSAGVRTWTPWQSSDPVPVGSTIWVNGITAPFGFLKENGALLSRVAFAPLFAFANASGNIVTEAQWLAGNMGSFSTGDLATTFRLPDTRGEFIRGWDNGRGVDPARTIGTNQSADNAPHTHAVTGGTLGGTAAGLSAGTNSGTPVNATAITLSSQGVEGRPRNIAKLACIKF